MANILLVHGAFADASSYRKVIPLLIDAGHTVVAVQNQLTGLKDDVATTRRVLDTLAGDTVIVGHSYGGGVISEAAYGKDTVKALVYLAAFPVDEGENGYELLGKYPATPLLGALAPDATGFLYIDRAQFHHAFCADLPEAEAATLAATQKPIFGEAFGQPAGKVAWHTVPSFFVVSENDNAVHPDLQRDAAERMKSTVLSLPSSHVSMLSHPDAVAQFILQAAGASV